MLPLLALLAWALGAMVAGIVVYGFHPILRWRYRHIPGPKPKWLLGNLLDVHVMGQEGSAERWSQQYGPVWLIWLGAMPVVMTSDPELAKKVLAKPSRHKIWCLHTGVERDYEAHTLFYANGEAWRASRAAWTPFFSKASMQGHGALMAAAAARLVSLLNDAADGGAEVDVWRSVGQLTMDVVGTTAFGVTFDTLSPPGQPGSGDGGPSAAAGDALAAAPPPAGASRVTSTAEQLLWAVRTVFEVCGPANPYFGLCFLVPELEGFFIWLVNAWPNSIFARELAARKIVKSVGGEVLQLSKVAAAAGGAGAAAAATPPAQPAAATAQLDAVAAPLSAGPTPVAAGSFLACVSRYAGKAGAAAGMAQMDDTWATNQATTFLVSGYESTANCIAFTVYLLATNPDKEDLLLAEIDRFGRQRAPTVDELETSFPYTTACMTESMRIYPPSVVALRQAPAPMRLGGYALPAGTALQVSMYAMHRSPRLWRDPLAFKPERFLAGTPEAEEVVPGAFAPWGSGPRACVGLKFAEAEAVITLVRLYQQYTFRLTPGQVPLKTKTLITHGPVGGVRVTVHRR